MLWKQNVDASRASRPPAMFIILITSFPLENLVKKFIVEFRSQRPIHILRQLWHLSPFK